MNDERQDRWEQLLDLLAEGVAERLRSEPRSGDAFRRIPRPADEATPPLEAEPTRFTAPESTAQREDKIEDEPTVKPEPSEPESEPIVEPSLPAPPAHTARLLGRMALGLLALVIVINIPINRHGTTLATAMPDRRALVIRDGLVVKEDDGPEIYVYDDGAFRWISSLKAFEMRGYTWKDVHVVEDGFLEDYEIGPPIHVILKCPDSPHIYRVEGEEKRWIVDIEAFEAEGYVWEDVRIVSCALLRQLPDGETIPPGQGPPPRP